MVRARLQGKVTLGKGVRLAYVEQDPRLPPGETADQFIYGADTPAMSALRRFRAAAEAAVDLSEEDEEVIVLE